MDPVILVKKVSKVFKSHGKKIRAVDKVNFQVNKGEIFGLLGPNGAGKTTTIKMICGLVRPSGGSILVKGYNPLTELNKVHQEIGVVLEGNRNLEYRLTVKENLQYFGKLHFVYGRKLKKRIDTLLNFLSLEGKRDSLVGTLSRGMQQKVAIGVSIIADPPILLLDEPVLGLDVESSRLLKERTKEASGEFGKSILLTTHQMDVAQQLCDRIAIIKEGKIIVKEETENLIDLFTNPYYEIKLSNGKLNLKQRERLNKIPQVKIKEKINEEKKTISLMVKNEEKLYEVLKTLEPHQTPIISLGKERPSLEDVFVQLIKGAKK